MFRYVICQLSFEFFLVVTKSESRPRKQLDKINLVVISKSDHDSRTNWQIHNSGHRPEGLLYFDG